MTDPARAGRARPAEPAVAPDVVARCRIVRSLVGPQKSCRAARCGSCCSCVRVSEGYKTTAQSWTAFYRFFGGLVVRLLITG